MFFLSLNNMVYQAKELSAKLNILTLVGQEDGELEFAGTDKEWNEVNKCPDCMRDSCICDSERENWEEREATKPF
jgi:hypothetical protein